MVRSSASLLLPVAILASALVGCESQDAAEHRAAVKVIETASTTLAEAPAIGAGAAAKFNGLARDLRGLRGGSRELKASRDQMLCQVETRLSEILWQDGLADRVRATEAMAVLEANLQATKLLLSRLRAEETILARPLTDALVAERVERLQDKNAKSNARDRAAPEVAKQSEAIANATREAQALRRKAAKLKAHADTVDGISSRDLRIEAADILRQAAAIEAMIDNDSTSMELHHQMVLSQLTLQSDQAATGVKIVDEEIARAQQRAAAFREHTQTGRESAQRLISDLSDSSSTLITLLTGTVQENYEETISRLEAAADAAQKAAQSGSRDSREVDTLAAIRSEVGLITIASAHRNRLAESMRLLESLATLGEATLGSRWAETRAVLQDNWKEADAIVKRATTAAAQLASQLGGPLGESMLSLMNSPTEPPADN